MVRWPAVMVATAGVAVWVAAFTPLTAAGADPIAARIHGYRELGAAFKNVNDELKSGSPQIYILQLSARQIRDAAKLQYGWYPAGSEPRSGVKSAAKPDIWAQPAKFKAAQDVLASQAQGFFQAASSGNIDRIRIQTKSLGQACASCHRAFRTEDKK